MWVRSLEVPVFKTQIASIYHASDIYRYPSYQVLQTNHASDIYTYPSSQLLQTNHPSNIYRYLSFSVWQTNLASSLNLTPAHFPPALYHGPFVCHCTQQNQGPTVHLPDSRLFIASRAAFLQWRTSFMSIFAAKTNRRFFSPAIVPSDWWTLRHCQSAEALCSNGSLLLLLVFIRQYNTVFFHSLKKTCMFWCSHNTIAMFPSKPLADWYRTKNRVIASNNRTSGHYWDIGDAPSTTWLGMLLNNV